MIVHGTVDPIYRGVVDAFAALFASGDERGAATAVVVEGKPVVDLWAGSAKNDPLRPWRRDTLVNVFSVGKPLAALCLLRLVDTGRAGLDEVVVRYWPEFGAAGKHEVTLRQVLAHQAGLDLFRQPLERDVLLGWEQATELLAAAPPRWAPESTHGEHTAFYGHLVGEIVRRIDGRSLGAFFRDEVAVPWALEFAFGLEAADLPRVADVVDPDCTFAKEVTAADEMYRLALDNPQAMLRPSVVNGTVWRRSEIPAVNGRGTARAVALLYAGLAAGGTLDGVRLLSPDLVAEAVGEPQRVGRDEVLGAEVGWGLGVQIDAEGFGMGGIGGNVGWWSRDGYAFAYVTRRLGTHDRASAVEDAVRSALGLAPLET